MAKWSPFLPLEQNLIFLIRPRNCCTIISKNRNLVKVTPLSHTREPIPISELNFDLKNKGAQFVRCVIKGRVQGVFYRNWTIENATQLGLKGWVRNKRDGSVEALFSGKPESVDEMQERCRRGPPHAMVTGIQAFPCDDDPGTGFDRKPTV